MTLDIWRTMLRWEIAAEMGWSLEYVDSLSVEDIHEYLSIKHANAQRKVST